MNLVKNTLKHPSLKQLGQADPTDGIQLQLNLREMTLGGREKARAYLVNYLSTVIILYMIITYSWLQNIFRIKTSFNLHKSPAMWVFLPFSFYILRKLRFRLVKELSLGYTASTHGVQMKPQVPHWSHAQVLIDPHYPFVIYQSEFQNELWHCFLLGH